MSHDENLILFPRIENNSTKTTALDPGITLYINLTPELLNAFIMKGYRHQKANANLILDYPGPSLINNSFQGVAKEYAMSLNFNLSTIYTPCLPFRNNRSFGYFPISVAQLVK